MKQFIYSVKDKLAGFSQPFYVGDSENADAIAKRLVLISLVGVPKEQRDVKINDLSIIFIGIFDTNTGDFDIVDPAVVCECRELFEDEVNND